MSVARTATGQEGALLIDATGGLILSATSRIKTSSSFGEMKMFLFQPDDDKWVKLDGSKVDAAKHPKLAEKIKTLPKIEHMWVYAE